MDTPSGCAITAWSGTVDITCFPSSTEREPPVTLAAALPSRTLLSSSTNRLSFWPLNKCSLQPNDRFAIMPIFVYQRYKDGNPQHGWNQWVSFGARPEIFFTKYVSHSIRGRI